ncbi:uncharacterized protein C2845_PM07G11120 [Panicum miliaceum]|uniref:Ubiquitin-like protease family profile domain-containing protein n=1 Tax=Panicum miliaceum TaxID=4540 RepID=A0A3L6SLS4_PANMI|nr:uncharacterized protein C2845_PM07G11120 [Panicum miliaceum]
MRDPAPATAAGSAVPIDQKKWPVSIRSSPAKFLDIVKALDEPLKAEVHAKNFGGLLLFKPHYLDRQLLSWLMRKLNPEIMKLEIGGGKELAVTEHSVWCVFQIPNSGGDPPFMKDDEARVKRRELGVQSFLFSNTDSYIRLEDVSFTEDLQNIGNKNWCKAVVDSLRKAARLYKKDFPQKGINAPITGCGIFLMHGLDTNPFSLPRCAFLDTKTIEEISAKDPTGCAAAPAPQVDRSRSDAAGTSAHAAGTSHYPGGHAPIFLQPPTVYSYPSFGASFGQSIADVVGRSRKSEALRILKAFDDSTSEAQKFMAKAVEYTSLSQELVAKAHHECFSAMQKLLVDARVDKIATNEATRSSRATNDDATSAHAASSSPIADPHKMPGPDDLHFEYPSRSPSPIESLAPDNNQEIFSSGNRSPPTPSALLGSLGLDSVVNLIQTSSLGDYFTDENERNDAQYDAPKSRRPTGAAASDVNGNGDGGVIGDRDAQRDVNADAPASEGAKEPDAAVGKNAEASKKVVAGKKKGPKAKAGGNNKRVKLQIAKDGQQRRDEHEKMLMHLRQVAADDISKLKSSIPGEACPNTPSCSLSFPEDPIDDIKSQTPPIRLSQEERKEGSRPNVPLSKALALRNKIAIDEKRETTLIDYNTDISFHGNDLITTFTDDKDGDSSILDFTVHCLRYDDIVHKEDSIGYRVFLSTSLYAQLKEAESIYMDDGIFIPVYAQRHYFVYCINLIHQRIDILDSINYFWTATGPDTCHEPIKNKLPSFMNAAFQKFKGMIYRVDLMHYLMFHPLNQADLPDELDVYRLGGRKVDWNSSQ